MKGFQKENPGVQGPCSRTPGEFACLELGVHIRKTRESESSRTLEGGRREGAGDSGKALRVVSLAFHEGKTFSTKRHPHTRTHDHTQVRSAALGVFG